MAGALTGLRVLDLSRILAGPWATQNFADMGADVIKIERPGEGDDTRKMGPPWIRDRDSGENVDAAYYASCNRGKRSVTLDIAAPEGQAIAHRLIDASDVLVENYKVGTLAKYGLDYASVAKRNPRLVYCSITGFGQTGPYRHRPGYDFLIQGMGGLMSVTGQRDDRPGGGPQRAGVALADILCGMYATSAILAALFHRATSGKGQYIDLALLDSQVATLANQGMNWLIGGVVPTRYGNGHPNLVPYQAFATTDGHIVLAIGNDEQFVRAVLRDRRPLRPQRRHALRDDRAAECPPRYADPDPGGDHRPRHDRALGGDAGGGRRALRSDQHDRPRVRRSAGAFARNAHRPSACPRRYAAIDREPDALFRHAGRIHARAAGARPAYRRGAARARRDRRRHLADVAVASPRLKRRSQARVQPSQRTRPLHAVNRMTAPNTMRYQANGTKSCRLT